MKSMFRTLGHAAREMRCGHVRACPKPHSALLLFVAVAASLLLLLRSVGLPSALRLRHEFNDASPNRGVSSGFSGGCTGGQERNASSAERNFTVVTAYFNLGSLQKGSKTATRGPVVYVNWMRPYRFMRNAVVAFFDDAAFAAAFAEVRQRLPTEIVMVNRSDTWAFSLHNRTQSVFAQPDYPKNHPKSTNAAYACAMHAKYELVARAASENPFGSTYFAWMDIGIYRTLASGEAAAAAGGQLFTLQTPACLRDESVMFARIYPMDVGLTTSRVLRDGLDWVGGGFFLARGDVVQRFFDDYRQRTTAYLSAGLANHDQSVIMAMYLPETKPRPVVPLQAVIPRGGDDPWFYFSLQARREALASPDASAPPAAASSRLCCSYELH